MLYYDFMSYFKVSDWIAFLGVNETREKDWIPEEKDGSVVANKIPISFFSVKLDSKTTRITSSVG